MKKPIFQVLKGVIISALIMCLIFAGVSIYQALNSDQNKDVNVPNFVGKTLVEAKENNPDNFQFEIKSKFVYQEPGNSNIKHTCNNYFISPKSTRHLCLLILRT